MRTKGITLGWLVGAVALLFAGCSSENDLAGEPKTVEEPTAQTQATVIHVTVGAGISDGEATTRSTVDYNTTTKTRTLTFTGPVGDPGDEGYSPGDRLYIVRALADGKCLAGELTMAAGSPTADGTQATFEGELRVYNSEGGDATHDFGGEDPLTGSTATLIHAAMSAEAGDYSFNFATGTLTFADATGVASSVEALMTKGLVVSGLYGASGFALQKATAQPILGCTIAGLTAGATFAMAYSVSADGTTYDDITTGTVTADAQGTATFACLATEEYNDGQASQTNIFHRIRLTNNGNGADTYDVSIGQKALQSKVYNLSRRFVNLASVTTETDEYGLTYFAAKNGQILTGNLNYNYDYVSIPDGATVTLSSVTFKNVYIQSNGAATINLEGTNTIENEWYVGILIESGTLTIQGSGRLSATGGDGATGIGGDDSANLVIKSGNITAQGGIAGAGIGSVHGGEFGTITIEGGTVVATGGEGSAGIGSASGGGSCGDITITGGNVTATGGEHGAGIGSSEGGTSCGNITISGTAYVTAKGGSGAAGIGSGPDGSSCGNISIANTVTSVTATSGGGDAQSIGAGSGGGSCDGVTIDGVENATTESTFEHLTSVVDGDTWTLTNASN